MSTSALVRNPQIYSIRKPRKSRARSGCLTCRARRKKCDERRPTCQSCERLQLSCSWPPSSANRAVPVPVKASFAVQSTTALSTPEAENRANTSSSIAPVDHESDVADTSEQNLLAELRTLGDQFRQSGIFPYNQSVASDVRDRLLASEGPETAMMFDHFCHKTAPWLISGDCFDNPILKHIVPLTIMDDLVLHTVLAVTGAHLQHSMPLIAPLAVKYYSYALHSLQQRLSDWLGSAQGDYKPLLATTVLLCHYEFIQGNTYGAALQHLRACRQFVEQALEHLQDPNDQDLVVLLLEHYGYFILIANLRGTVQDDNLRLGLEFSTDILPLIRNFPNFGSIFAFEPQAFFAIPQTVQLASQRRAKPSKGSTLTDEAKYKQLLAQFQDRRRQSNVPDSVDALDCKPWDTLQIVLSIKINALLMLLHTSFHGTNDSVPSIQHLLEPLIDNSIGLLEHVEENDTCYSLFWPVIIIGSYISDKAKQRLLLQRLETNQIGTALMYRGVELLRWLWSDQDKNDFGLAGLEHAAVAHGVDLCIC